MPEAAGKIYGSTLPGGTHKVCSRCGECKEISEFQIGVFRSGRNVGRSFYVAHCPQCRREYVREARAANVDEYRSKDRERNRKLRREVLEAYSDGDPKCACCGEATYEFLCVDHIDGGGKRHRKDIGGPSYLYKWLRKNRYPPGYRVLCCNCNHCIGSYGYCPHQGANMEAHRGQQ